MTPSTRPWVALLRAINVGGHNVLPMADLRAMFEAAGARDVRTYIQTGNVLFSAADAPAVAVAVRADIQKRGFDAPIVLRTAEELRAARAAAFEGDPKTTYVGFLSGVPATPALDPARSPGDRYVVIGRELHIAFGVGAARSKLTNDWIERQLGVLCTLRNLNTVDKLIALAGC